MRKKTQESVKIDSRLLDQVRKISKERGVMISWIINKAISEWLANESR